MKKYIGLKFNLILLILTIALAVVDIFLMGKYGFDGQLLIFLYVIIGVVPLCSIIALITGIFSPTIIIDNNARKIDAHFISNEIYKSNHNLRNSFTIIHFDEIVECVRETNKLIFVMKYNHVKTLYLSSFTEKQIIKIKNEIDKHIQ